MYDILCTVNTQHTSRQDAIITISLHLATFFGRLRPKHVAKCKLIVIIASCLDVCCVLTVHNISYTFDNIQRGGLSL